MRDELKGPLVENIGVAVIQLENEFTQSETLRIAALGSNLVEDDRSFANPTDVFTGRIQDIRFFDKQLTDANIEEMKNKNLPENLLESQISYWNLHLKSSKSKK